MFYQKLIECYSNQYAQKVIEDIRIRIFIYEHEFMVSSAEQESALMHDRIINFLLANKKPAAIKELKSNWRISIDYIINFYKKMKDE